MTFTKDQLIEQATHNLRLMKYQSDEQTCNEAFMADLELMKIALASLEAPPLAYRHRSGQVVTREECCSDEVFAICCKVETPLYAAPPAPVVPDGDLMLRPDEIERHTLTAGECAPQSKVMLISSIKRLNDCRDAMLQGKTESVREKVLRAQMQSIITDLNLPDDASLIDITNEICRLQGAAGNSPAIPDGYALVPVEPTEGMIAAAMSSDDVLFDTEDDTMFRVQHGVIWRAMLAAAQQQEVKNG